MAIASASSWSAAFVGTVSRRRVLGGAAAAVGGVLAGACGVMPGTGGEAPSGSAKPAALEVWIVDWQPTTQTAYETQVLPTWQKQNPNVTVTMNWPTWTNMHEQLLTRFAADNPPDIFQTGASFVPEIAGKKMGMVLDQLLAQWGKKADFFPAPLGMAAWEGKQFGLPY
jgi:ABC-type glycerol-3-phosphate transport system substrate-binding protein